MATEKQIEANRRNALLSTGPKTDEGKAVSRLNAVTHGLTMDEPADSPEFVSRRASWAEEVRPEGLEANFALDKAIAATFRVERCRRTLDANTREIATRATESWEADRRAEAVALFDRLPRKPQLISRQLRRTYDGADLLADAWKALLLALDERAGWTPAEKARALDLLGVPLAERDVRTPLHRGDAAISDVDHFRTLALTEVSRLETFRDEALSKLDAMDRAHAESGLTALLSRPSTLILRYERESHRAYDQALKLARIKPRRYLPTPTPIPAASPAPIVAPPRPNPPVVAPVAVPVLVAEPPVEVAPTPRPIAHAAHPSPRPMNRKQRRARAAYLARL